MQVNVSVTGRGFEVSFKQISQQFPLTPLGLTRTVAFAMTFGEPIYFWVGPEKQENISSFLQKTGIAI